MAEVEFDGTTTVVLKSEIVAVTLNLFFIL